MDPIACEGCGVCFHVCPQEAVRLKDVQSGEWFVSETRYGPMVHAKLGVAQDNSGKLVTIVRKEGQRIAKEGNYPLVLIDGPPGIGCPVIASVGGVDAALLVTEPSVSGLHDLERVLAVCRHFQVPAWVCVNKWDISPEYTEKIEVFAKDAGSRVIGKLPFDPAVTRAMVAEKTILEYSSWKNQRRNQEIVDSAALLFKRIRFDGIRRLPKKGREQTRQRIFEKTPLAGRDKPTR